jgi:FKBP-type peptidyl-prolyl cis-trans isomerase (trigger factor)
VAKAENLEVTDEEAQDVITQMALANRLDVKELEKRIRKNDRIFELKEQILRDKAAGFVVDSSVAGPPEAEPAAGKKPATKKATGTTAKAKAKADVAAAPVEPAADTVAADAAE